MKHRRFSRLLCRWCAFVAVVSAMPAGAVDIVTASAPATIRDGQMTVGGRSLRLPDGKWNFVGKDEGFVMVGSTDRSTPHYAGYAMDVDNGQMRSGVMLRLPVNSTPTTSWNEQPCKVEGELFKDTLGGNFKYPECLVVFKRTRHLANPVQPNPLFAQARQWAIAQSVKLGPVYEIAYSRYGTNDFGVVRIFLPVQAFGGDGDAVGWARLLPSHLRPLFENRASQVSLPPFPMKGAT